MQVWEGGFILKCMIWLKFFCSCFFCWKSEYDNQKRQYFLVKSVNSNSQKNKEFFNYIFIVAARIFGWLPQTSGKPDSLYKRCLLARFTCCAVSFTFFIPKILLNMRDQAFYTDLRYARRGRKSTSVWQKNGIIILPCLWIRFLYWNAGNAKNTNSTPLPPGKGFISVLPFV